MGTHPRRYWLAACGLDCGACSIHLRTEEELAHWRDRGVDPDRIRCDGCRSDPQGCHWSGDCAIRACCLEQRGLFCCAECPDLPCEALRAWGQAWPHHARAVERLLEMRAVGVDSWLEANGYG